MARTSTRKRDQARHGKGNSDLDEFPVVMTPIRSLKPYERTFEEIAKERNDVS